MCSEIYVINDCVLNLYLTKNKSNYLLSHVVCAISILTFEIFWQEWSSFHLRQTVVQYNFCKKHEISSI